MVNLISRSPLVKSVSIMFLKDDSDVGSDIRIEQYNELYNQITTAAKEQGADPGKTATELIKQKIVFTAVTNFLISKKQENGLVQELIHKTFVVGEVFQHRVQGLIPQYHGDNFKSWLWAMAKERIVSTNEFGKNILKKYVLPANMKDTQIQNAAKSTPMGENQFWVMLYLLIIEPKLGRKILKYALQKDKVYIFHVKLASGKVVAVNVDWNGGEWDLNANDFVREFPWNGGFVFLYPVAV
jgi:hypothetical protein